MPSKTAVLSVWKEFPMAAARAESSCHVSLLFASAAAHQRPGEAGHVTHQHLALGGAGHAQRLLIEGTIIAQPSQVKGLQTDVIER